MLNKFREGIFGWFKTEQEIESLKSTSVLQSPIVQEDAHEYELKKRVNKSFDEQAQQMQARSMIKHGRDCDIFTCVGDQCPPWSPDNVVAAVYDPKFVIEKKQ
jgi:hypothetical protein